MRIRGLQCIGVQNLGLLPEAQGRGLLEVLGEDDVPPESVVLVPGFNERRQKWKLDSGFFAGLVLPFSPIFLSVLLVFLISILMRVGVV